MDTQNYLNIEECKKGLYSKFKDLKSKELLWYKNEALNVFQCKDLPKINHDNFIGYIYPKSISEMNKKAVQSIYYKANAAIFLNIINDLLEENFINLFNDKSSLNNDKDTLLIYNYYNLFYKLLFDSLILLDDYLQNIRKEKRVYGLGRRWNQSILSIYQSIRQMIYGQDSFHSFIEFEPDISILLIRQLIELKIRRGFGILGLKGKTDNKFQKVNMGIIFEIIDEFKDKIDFSIPLSNLKIIYGWANIFVHSGFKVYHWQPLFVLKYLKNFSIGKEPTNSSFNINSGITMPKEVFDEIQLKFQEKYPNDYIIKFEPAEAVLT